MKLTRFRVQNFRSFVDSGWVDCQDVTAIAGVNEAGKSNLLRALWKLKPAFKSDNKILRTDIPIDKVDKIMNGDDLPVFISAEFKLRPMDKEILHQRFRTLQDFDTVIVSRTLSGEYIIEYPFVISDSLRKRVDSFILKNMPGFIYYSNYGNLDSNIYLPQILSKFNKSGVNTISKSKRRTVKLLLMYIGITPEMLAVDTPVLAEATSTQMKLTPEQLFQLTSTHERYKKLFRQAGERLSQEFNQWWHQGQYKFEFVFDRGNLNIFVTDQSGIKAPLDARSVGMQWFLSFFLVFSLESQLFYSNTIMLLDESGATLHGLAQQDLVNFFDELSKTSQLIYSTHSNFMLPVDKINRTRIVYRDEKGHSIVANDVNTKNNLQSKQDGLIPISTALNMSLNEMLLKMNYPVLVLNDFDEIYLNIIKDALISENILVTQMIKKPLMFIRVDKDAVNLTAQVLEKEGKLPSIYMDTKQGNLLLYERLANGLYKTDNTKIILPQIIENKQTIEDYIPYELFAQSCGDYLVSLLGNEFSVKTAEPFLSQIEDAKEDLVLPSDFRLQMAKLTSDYIKKNNIRFSRATLKLWENLFAEILRNLQ